MKTVQLSTGVTIAYEDIGSGEPIVLLHGFCGSHSYWDEIVPLLAEHGRVLTPDLRGHGESSATEGQYAMELLAEDIEAWLEELGLSGIHLFGHSLGGYVALAFAEKYPERLQSFGLLHSTSYPDTDAAKEGRVKAAQTIASEGIATFVDGLIPKLFTAEHQQSGSVQKAKEIGYRTSPHGAAGCALGMGARGDRTGVLERLELPVLLLAGEEDAVIPQDRRFPVAKASVQAVTLKQVAHMGMMEDPGAFAAALTEFLDGIKVNGIV